MRSVQISLPVQNKMRNFVNNADITMARVSEEMRWRMVTLSEDVGWSYNKIAEHFGRSKSTVRDQIKRFKETGSVKDRPRIGRPTVLDEEDEETLMESVVADPFTTLPQFQSILREQHVNMSQSTIFSTYTSLGV